VAGSDPNNIDTDNDKMPDGWEIKYGLDPTVRDSDLNNDNDGLPNYWELWIGALPN
jgi:hypothetical protein